MTQKIEIGVQANTGGAEAGVRKVDNAAQQASESVSDIATAAAEAGAGLDRLSDKASRLADTTKRASESAVGQARYTAQRIADIQKQLSDVLGRPVGFADARAAAQNFEVDRAKGRFKTRQVTNARDYGEYLETSGTAIQIDPRRRAYRNEVISSSMRGTQAAANGGARPPEPPAPPGGGGEIVDRGKSMAMNFGKSMLALAGLTSIMGMAGQAVDMANEESIGLDTLKRRSGDLGVSFSKLQDNVRSATDGLGLTYVESVRLAQQYAKTAGTFGTNTSLKASYGFSRAFGLDPSQGVDFFASMQRIKAVGGDEQSQRRLALMVGEAVSKSGYSGKADELLAAVNTFAQDIARQTLTAPNLTDITGYLTTLTKSGYPGLDPQNAMAMIGSADQSVRRGGGMGDASMNFIYAALAKASPGLNVYDASALMQGGLFATTNSTFGKNTPLGDMYGGNVPGLNDTTNLTKIMGAFKTYYGGNKRAMVDAMKNTLGLQSYDQAAAFYEMYQKGPENLDGAGKLIRDAKIDPSKLSATGIYKVGDIAAAKGVGDLQGIFRSVMGRKDISDKDKEDLAKVFQGSNADAMRLALTKVIATHDQEKTPGSETRDSIAELKNELTRVGGALQEVLNPIRFAVEALAEHLAPEQWRQHKQDMKDVGVDFHKAALDSGVTQGQMAGRYASLDGSFSTLTNRGTNAYKAANMLAPKPSFTDAGDPRHYALAMDAYRHLHGLAAAKSLNVSDEQRQAMLAAAGGDKDLAADLENILRWENRGQGVAHDLTSKKGAQGYFQMLPSTFAEMHTGGNIHNFADEARAAAEKVRRARKRFGNNKALIAADWDGGTGKAKWLAKGNQTGNTELNEYMAGFTALGQTPMPSGGPKSDSQNHNITIALAGETHLVAKDDRGNHIGTTKVTPFVSSAPAGGHPAWVGGVSK